MNVLESFFSLSFLLYRLSLPSSRWSFSSFTNIIFYFVLRATATIIQSEKHPWTLQLNLDTILLLCSSSQLQWKWKLRLTLCDSLDYAVHGILQNSRILEWVAIPFCNPEIFPTQGSNPGLLHCRQILYHLSHQGSPRILEWVAYPFSRGTSDPGIKLGSPALQVDSLPAELQGSPYYNISVDKVWKAVSKLKFSSAFFMQGWTHFLNLRLIFLHKHT